jgi:predicted PhzF superfamily epimerase YddE/YHI9
VRTGSSIEPSRVANLLLFTQLAQQFPMLAKYVFRYMNIPNSSQLEREFDENAQLRQALEDSREQLEQLEQLVERLGETVRDKNEQVEVQKIRTELNKIVIMAKAQEQVRAAQQKQSVTQEKR